MLQRPEYNTHAHIRLWLAGKDPKETFDWNRCKTCACGQYLNEHRTGIPWWHGPIGELNEAGRAVATKKYGELTERGQYFISFGDLAAEFERRYPA
jgi:hypothetical protein